MAQEHILDLVLNARVNGGFNSAFAKAQAEFTKLGKDIQGVHRLQADVSSYQKQQAAMASTHSKLDNLKKQYTLIQKEIDETTGSTAALEREKLKLEQRIGQTAAALENYERKAEQTGNRLRSAGVDTDNLADETRRLSEEYNTLRTRQKAMADTMEDSGQKAGIFGAETVEAVQTIQQALLAAGIVQLIREIGAGMVDSTRAAIEFESAITGVYKTVDGTDVQLGAIRNDIRELTTEIPATAEEIAAVAEAAGQLGIATGSIMDFTQVMIDLGESTNLSAEEAASSLAKFANITGTASGNYSRLGSVVVALGNNSATTEADIVEMSTRLASAGRLAGLSEAEIMALATAMSSVGIEAEAGGTAMTQTLSAIEKAVVKGGEKLQGFARLAGMSAEEFVVAWEGSPIEAIQALISGIGGLEAQGESAVLVLDELGLSGVRQSNMLKSLGLAADKLGGAVSMASTAWDENIALSMEAGKRYATTESQLAMLNNGYHNLKVAIGNAYTPAVRNASEAGIVLLDGLTDFVEKNPAVIKGLTAIAGGITTAGVVIGGVAVATKLATPVMAAFNAVMGMNSAVLITAGVVGLTTAIAALVAATENDAIPSVQELTEAARDMNEAMAQAETAYKETATATAATAEVAQTYIGRLEEIEAATGGAVAGSQEYHNILALLTRTVPELAGYIDLENNAIRGGTEALREHTEAWKKNAEAQAYQDYINSLYDEHAAVMAEATENSILLTQAQIRLGRAEENRDATLERMNTLSAEAYKNGGMLSQEYYTLRSALYDYNHEIYEAERTIKNLNKAINEDGEAIAAAEAEIESASEAMAVLTGETEEQLAASEELARQETALRDVIGAVTGEVAALADAYTEAYTAAMESIQGQYALWDEAADVAATSAGDINSALESQVAYWSGYNESLSVLSQRAGEIEGLNEIIASFADGSAESVNAIAGLANAAISSDEELVAMVETWRTLQEEEQKAAEVLAQFQTDLPAAMDELVSEIGEDIKSLNLSEDASESARATLQSFIDQAGHMLPDVQAAYHRVATTVQAALSSSGVRVSMNYHPHAAYASGTNSAAPGVALVGEQGPELVYFNGGEVVVPAPATAALLRDQSVVPAAPTEALLSSPGNSITLHIAPVYQFSGKETPEQMQPLLEANNEALREMILEVIAEASRDAARRAYV